jgi:hypothetical protein
MSSHVVLVGMNDPSLQSLPSGVKVYDRKQRITDLRVADIMMSEAHKQNIGVSLQFIDRFISRICYRIACLIK